MTLNKTALLCYELGLKSTTVRQSNTLPKSIHTVADTCLTLFFFLELATRCKYSKHVVNVSTTLYLQRVANSRKKNNVRQVSATVWMDLGNVLD